MYVFKYISLSIYYIYPEHEEMHSPIRSEPQHHNDSSSLRSPDIISKNNNSGNTNSANTTEVSKSVYSVNSYIYLYCIYICLYVYIFISSQKRSVYDHTLSSFVRQSERSESGTKRSEKDAKRSESGTKPSVSRSPNNREPLPTTADSSAPNSPIERRNKVNIYNGVLLYLLFLILL